jgi:hypothetical protein
MYGLLLCDWTRVLGTSTSSPIIQGEDQWLDLAPYQDVVYWVDVRDVSGTVQLNLETAPTKDDLYFKPMVSAAGLTTLAAGVGPVAYPALVSSALVPLARWVRWKLISASGTWNVTMRIFASVNAPGG